MTGRAGPRADAPVGGNGTPRRPPQTPFMIPSTGTNGATFSTFILAHLPSLLSPWALEQRV